MKYILYCTFSFQKNFLNVNLNHVKMKERVKRTRKKAFTVSAPASIRDGIAKVLYEGATETMCIAGS